MNTKEEILKSNHAEKVINWDKVFVQNPTIIQSAYEAMDTYAKQEAIAFAEFIKDNHYTINLNSEDARWYKYFSVREDFPSGVSMLSGVSEYFTTEQLYSLYQSK